MLRRLVVVLAVAYAGSAPPLAAAQSRGGGVAPQGASMEHVFRLRALGGLIHEHVAVSPSGDEIALFERGIDLEANRYVHRLLVVDVRTGAHRIVAEAGDIILISNRGRRSGAPLDREPVWSLDGAWIYYLAERERRVEIWRARSDGSGTELVMAPLGDVRRFALTKTGDALVYETLTPRTDIAAQRAREEREGFRVDEDFAPLYSLRPLPDEEDGAQTMRLLLATAETRPANDAERARLVPAPADVVVRPLDPSSRVEAPPVGVLYAAGGRDLACSAPECTGALKDAWLVQYVHGPLVVFRRLEGHARFVTALYGWRPGEAQVRLIRRETDRLEGCVAADGALVCLQDFATQPRRLVRIDLKHGAVSVLYDPNPQWRFAGLPRIERLDYTDGEGNQSFAHVVYPLAYRRGRAYPLVIVQYRSRGFLNAGTGGETPIFPLSALGYLVLSVDRPEFDERATRLTVTELMREIELDDSEHRIKREANLEFVSELERRGLVDRGRIGITGMSDGAETVFDMLMDAPIFRAAVVGSPPQGPIAYELQSRRFRAQRFEQVGLTPPWAEDGPFFGWWRENSPTLRNEPIRAALMMNLSESEMLRGVPLLARLEQTTTPVETYVYPGAYHIKWRPTQVWAAQQRTVDWLNFWLRGVESDLSNDPDQYVRWRAMRVKQCELFTGADAPWYCRQ